MKKNTEFWRNLSIILLIIGVIAALWHAMSWNVSKFNNICRNYKDIIEFFSALISISAVVSIFLLIKQIKDEHEKSRREKCLDLLMTWSTNLAPETNFAVKIVEKFDREQCTKLYRMEEFYVSKKLCYEIKEVYSEYSKEDETTVCKYLNGIEKQDKKKCDGCELCKKDKKSDNVILDKYYIKKLRFSVIQYLNLLETVLIGWQNGIVDRDIIETQFSYLHDPSNNKNCLQDFRIASGLEETYPSIEAFCIKLEENRKKKIKKKDYIFINPIYIYVMNEILLKII